MKARIERAKQLLLRSDATIDEIARKCGFLETPRLYEAFKRETGITPGQYRKNRGV